MDRQIAITTLHLFPKLDRLLIELLHALKPEDWRQFTYAKLWTVKEVAAHLLDGNLRTLSILRDGYQGDPPANVSSYQDLVEYLNRLNADWVQAFKRLSPQVLIDWLERSGKEYHQYLSQLDPFAPSVFSVAWAERSIL
jgi:hypothetical protein